jgi:hypothetical protein
VSSSLAAFSTGMSFPSHPRSVPSNKATNALVSVYLMMWLTAALTGPRPTNVDFRKDAIRGSASNALLCDIPVSGTASTLGTPKNIDSSGVVKPIFPETWHNVLHDII